MLLRTFIKHYFVSYKGGINISILRGARCYLNWLGIKILENFNTEGHKFLLLFLSTQFTVWAGYRSRYSDWLRAGRSGDRIPVEAKFSTPVQTGPGAHPTSCAMGLLIFSSFYTICYILFYFPSPPLLALVFYVYCNNFHNLCYVDFVFILSIVVAF
jgi:hypothetical protein